MSDELWTIPNANVTYTRSQNYTNAMVGNVLLLLLLSFDVFFHTNAHPLLYMDKWFVQTY